jgi:hypothetical protein
MRGPHDLGGIDGFGPVAAETNEPVFHAAWEARALGVVLANGAIGEWTIDQTRAKRESLPPVAYWSLSYYEIWLAAMAELLKERGLASLDEIATGSSRGLLDLHKAHHEIGKVLCWRQDQDCPTDSRRPHKASRLCHGQAGPNRCHTW